MSQLITEESLWEETIRLLYKNVEVLKEIQVISDRQDLAEDIQSIQRRIEELEQKRNANNISSESADNSKLRTTKPG